MHFAIPRFLWQNAMSCGFPGIYSWLYHIGFGTMNDDSNVFLYWLDGNLAAGWDTSEFIVTWMKNTRISNCNCKFARSFSSQTNECRLRYRLWMIVLTFVPFISDTRTLGRIYAKREEKKNRLWKEGMVFYDSPSYVTKLVWCFMDDSSSPHECAKYLSPRHLTQFRIEFIASIRRDCWFFFGKKCAVNMRTMA